MLVAAGECIVAWDVACITSVARRDQSIQCNAFQSFPTNTFSETYVGNANPDEITSQKRWMINWMRTFLSGQACIIQRRNGLIIPASCKSRCRPYHKWSWKLACKQRHMYVRSRAEWMRCMPPCSNPFLCVLKRISVSNKSTRSARLYEQISKV